MLSIEAAGHHKRARCLVRAVPIGRKPGTVFRRARGIFEEFVFIGRNRRECLPGHIVERRRETHDSRDIRRARFKLFPAHAESRLGKCNILDHVPAALPGRHLYSRWAFPYSAPIPVGPKTLCPERRRSRRRAL